MKNLKRIFLIFIVTLIVGGVVPMSAFAVDPVSAATMANAFAQAVTAYGASQGVSMTFDVTNTDGIGEGVHELWDQFKTDVNDNDVPTYDSIAVTIWSTLFKKAGNNVAFDLSAETVSYLDRFWNWLLSGPAEMTKIDNQYVWYRDPDTGVVSPVPVKVFGSLVINGKELILTDNIVIDTYSGSSSNPTHYSTISWKFNQPVYAYTAFNQPSNSYRNVVILYDIPFSFTHTTQYYNGSASQYETGFSSQLTSSKYGDYQYYTLGSYSIQSSGDLLNIDNIWSPLVDLPYYYNLDDRRAVPAAIFGAANSADMSTDTSSISVQPYVGDTVPQNVYIPDNDDVNYTPVPATIPIDVSWDDSIFGDGSGTLTDAQGVAATDAISDAITQNPAKTLELAETDNPPLPGTEVYTPLLPIELPDFNFSFSGIWHYVREWVGSIGTWISMMFTVWSHLPYAISVPVYATAVIVIVLGVYKRFFM